MEQPDKTKTYSNGEVSIVWKPDVCIHSKICWKGLITVFNPGKRPWIDMEGGQTQQIIDQVQKCPSGALSHYLNKEKETAVVQTTDTTIEVTPNGPLLVYGTVKIKHHDGTETMKYKTTALCRCGQSANKPFCDGTHTKIAFEG